MTPKNGEGEKKKDRTSAKETKREKQLDLGVNANENLFQKFCIRESRSAVITT